MAKDSIDSVNLRDDGTIWLVVAGQQHRLRRPTTGQYREAQERWRDLTAEESSMLAADNAAIEDEGLTEADATLLRRKTREQVEELIFAWWRWVVGTLDRDGADLPESDDDLPPWLTSIELVTELFQFWPTVPWAPGGRPSVREAKAMEPMMDKLSALLASLPKSDQGS